MTKTNIMVTASIPDGVVESTEITGIAIAFQSRGSKPPEIFSELVRWADNPDKVIEWKKEYKFDLILCFCWCCQGASPVFIYGWKDKEDYGSESEDESDGDFGGEEFEWTPDSSFHMFHIDKNDIEYFGKKHKLF
jgi:hypothetical protein